MAVANDPGEQLFPGELAKTLAILAAGREVNYVGASVGPDESAGNYRQMAVEERQARYRTLPVWPRS